MSELLSQLGDDFKLVADEADVRDLKDRRFLVQYAILNTMRLM